MKGEIDMQELMKKLDSEQCIIMGLTTDGKCNLTVNCDEALPAGLLELIQSNLESKRTLQDIHMILTMVLTADKHDGRIDN